MSAPMTEQQLAEIETRAKAATPGEWEADDEWTTPPYRVDVVSEIHGWITNITGIGTDIDPRNGSTYRWAGFDRWEDAAFIAAARDDVPALVAEVRRLRAALHTIARCCGPIERQSDQIEAIYELAVEALEGNPS